jgi:hypothetical protein
LCLRGLAWAADRAAVAGAADAVRGCCFCWWLRLECIYYDIEIKVKSVRIS